ncbi:MAG TPA: hypothetical protein VM260_10945, partial [Pirellula sp.]|nr:hypothetical protein [Pirellula sp.]
KVTISCNDDGPWSFEPAVATIITIATITTRTTRTFTAAYTAATTSLPNTAIVAITDLYNTLACATATIAASHAASDRRGIEIAVCATRP